MRDCTLLDSPSGTLQLRQPSTCPDWILVNPEQTGYYQTLYSDGLLELLSAPGWERLGPVDHLGLFQDVQALTSTGDMGIGAALAFLTRFDRETDARVVGKLVDLVTGLRPVVPEKSRSDYAGFVRHVFGDRARQLGWMPSAGEDDEAKLLRPKLVGLVAREGGDEELAAQAADLAKDWLTKRMALSPEIVDAVLQTAAYHGDRTLLDSFRSELQKVEDSSERRHLISALGAFSDPALAREALQVFLTDASGNLAPSAMQALRTRYSPNTGCAFTMDHYEQLAQMLPDHSAAYLPIVCIESACRDRKRYEEVKSFFEERSPSVTGGPRLLAQILEAIRMCAAQREHHQPGLVEFLREH